MPDLVFEQPRHFPTTDLSSDLVLVVPDEMVTASRILRVQQAIVDQGGKAPDIIAQKDFTGTLFQDTHLIACGNMANNAALRRLYTARCCFVDTFFPGKDGYFIKSVSDPFGYGKNCIIVGASSGKDLLTAIDVFEEIVRHSDETLTRVHACRFDHALPPLPDESQLGEMIRSHLAIWGGGWSASPFRDGHLKDYMWYYYLTDHPVWGKAIPPIFAGSIGTWRVERREHPESYHCFFGLHTYLHLWDLIEDSPLYTDDDRRSVVTMLGELLRHLAGLFYLKEEVNPPGDLRQNHSTFIGLNLAFGHDYMVKRHGIKEFTSTVEAVERIFEGQANCYKPNDDAGVGYAWLVPQTTLLYLLYRNDYRYIDNGHVADLCKLAVVTTDNMRSEGSYGDTSGYAGFSSGGWEGRLWPLMVSTWSTRHPQHLWTLNWLGEGKKPSLGHVLTGLYAGVEFDINGFALEGCEPKEPVDLLGIYPMPLPEPALRWVRRHAPASHHPDPHKRYFDKLSLRRNFDPQDEYLLLEGVGTFCHGHEDSNAIIRLTWKNRAWLADGDYIRAAPKFHNAVTVSRDGVGVLEPPGDGVVIPPLTSLNYTNDGPSYGLLQTEVSGYNGVNWLRNIFWKKGRYFVIIDQLRCTTAGEYQCRCLWRLVGEVEEEGSCVRLHQQGERFSIHNAGGAEQEVVPDRYEGGSWTGYPYADKTLHVLHQKVTATLQPGDTLTYLNLLTPYEEIRIERLSDLMIRVVDGEETTILGSGNGRLRDVEIEATMFVLSLIGKTLTVQGVERLRFEKEELRGETQSLDVRNTPIAHSIQSAMTSATSYLPLQSISQISQAILLKDNGLNVKWSRIIGNAEISDVDVCSDTLLVGTEDGQVVRLAVHDGAEVWSHMLREPASALLMADIDQDGVPEALVGAHSDLMVLDGQTGAERWRRELKNISGRGAKVTAMTVADLDGSGQMSVLAGTAGWYVNAFTGDGTLLWANWIRYHVITALTVADADGDGKAEVMVGNIYSTPLSVHNFDGSFRWSTLEQVGSEGNATTPRRGIGLTHMKLNDLDRDGVQEIIYGTGDGWIYAVKPQDGTEVWRTNVVGEVTGLLIFPFNVVVAGEYGDLYSFDNRGQLRWRRHVAEWIRGIVTVEDRIVIAAENGTLLTCNLDGERTGSTSAGGEIRGMWSYNKGVMCSVEGGWLSRIDRGG